MLQCVFFYFPSGSNLVFFCCCCCQVSCRVFPLAGWSKKLPRLNGGKKHFLCAFFFFVRGSQLFSVPVESRLARICPFGHPPPVRPETWPPRIWDSFLGELFFTPSLTLSQFSLPRSGLFVGNCLHKFSEIESKFFCRPTLLLFSTLSPLVEKKNNFWWLFYWHILIRVMSFGGCHSSERK